jgi:hypothetical protein
MNMPQKTMKTSIATLSLILLLAFSACEQTIYSDEDLKGLWINESNDSLCFTTFLHINGSLPYEYIVANDSLRIHAIWSSRANDWMSYKIQLKIEQDQVCLHHFLGKEQTTFSKRAETCGK